MSDSQLTPALKLLSLLARQPAVLVRIQSTQGSVPREAGTWMAVLADSLVGTIGGGHLEHEAIAQAKALLSVAHKQRAVERPESRQLRFALGPALGQCCGGVVHLELKWISADDCRVLCDELTQERVRQLHPVALFGGGHVGHALVRVLAGLPFALTWIDSREEVFPDHPGADVVCEHSEPVHAAVPALAAQSRVLIMSFSHAEDLDVLAACLQRQREKRDLPFIGLIGSKTKWATFRQRLEARGFSAAELSRVCCPIGVPGISGKEPEVIAVAVAAQLLQTVSKTL